MLTTDGSPDSSSLHDTLMARLDRLPGQMRAQIASVSDGTSITGCLAIADLPESNYACASISPTRPSC